MRRLTNNITGPAQQVALLEKKVKELEDASAQQAAEILSMKEPHNREVDELKTQLTQIINARIHLADQLEQSKKSNITLKDKYEALCDEKKSTTLTLVLLLDHSNFADFFHMPHLLSVVWKTEHERKILELEKGVESLKNDAMKYKTQYDEAVSINQTLNKDLDDMTKKAE